MPENDLTSDPTRVADSGDSLEEILEAVRSLASWCPEARAIAVASGARSITVERAGTTAPRPDDVTLDETPRPARHRRSE